MTDAQLIQLWNLLFPDNDAREISEQDLREGLIAFLNTFSIRIGNLPDLQTPVKSSIVNAINSVNYRLELLSDRFSPQFGQANPNVVPPPVSADFGSLYVQEEVIEGDVRYIGFWIFTGVDGIGWLSLTDSARIKELMFFENGDTHNYPPSKKGDIKFIKIWDESAGVEIPNGYAFLGGNTGKIVGNDTVLITREDNVGGTQSQVGDKVIVLNQRKQIVEVSVLPTAGLVNTYYLTPDDKLWKYYAFGTVEKPAGWYSIGGSSSESSMVNKHTFIFNGNNAIQETEFPINEVLDFQIEGLGGFEGYAIFTNGENKFDATTAIDEVMFAPARCKLLYKTNI